jgi:hypothetical protein
MEKEKAVSPELVVGVQSGGRVEKALSTVVRRQEGKVRVNEL